jgi:hypothetical protein
MIFRLLAITFVFVNMAGFAKSDTVTALMAKAGFKVDGNQ